MCLDYVDKKVKAKPEGFMWKVFSNNKDGLSGEYHHKRRNYKPNVWLKANKGKWLWGHEDDKRYGRGFHGFKTKVGAEDWMGSYSIGLVVVKVKYRNPVATGRQSDRSLIVAKEMMILED